MRAAAARHEAAQRARIEHERERRAIETDLERRRKGVRAEYIRRVKRACDAARRKGLPGSDEVPLYKRKKPLFRPQVVTVRLLIIPGAASEWRRAGTSGPKWSDPQSLYMGYDIKPALMGDWREGERLPYEFYERARSAREDVLWLDDVMDNHRRFGQDPEVLLDLLTHALAGWAAVHLRELDLNP